MQVVFVVVMVGSLYLLFAGHNQPGGGFVGGIVAGAAIALRYISGGIAEVRKLSRGQPWLALGAGMLIASLDGTRTVALRRSGARGLRVHLRPPAARRGQDHHRVGLRLRRLPRRDRAGADDVRVVRRRPAAAASGALHERAHGRARRLVVRDRHLPADAAQAVADHRRARSAQPRRQRLVRQLRPSRHPRADRLGRPGRLRRPGAPGAGAHGHRDQLRHHCAAPGAGVPQLVADLRRRGCRRRRGPPGRCQRLPRRRGRRRDAADRRGGGPRGSRAHRRRTRRRASSAEVSS